MTEPVEELKTKNEEICKIRAEAFIKIICHSSRFYKEKAKPGENQCTYGFLIGQVDNGIREIKDVEPILHHPTPDLEFDEKFISDMDAFNLRFIEEESTDRIIGWYKSVNEPVKFRAMDVKNQLKFQTLNKNFVGLIFDPQKFYANDGYGFGIYSLMTDRYGDINIMSDHYRIPWEIQPLGEHKDSTIQLIKDLIDKLILGKKFVTELDEIE